MQFDPCARYKKGYSARNKNNISNGTEVVNISELLY